MLPNQKAAVIRCLGELITATKYQTAVVVSYFHVTAGILSKEERDVVESKVIDADKLHTLFNILKEKESGWLHLLAYLRENDQSHVADKLENDANEEGRDSVDKSPKSLALKEFSLRLKKYYKLNYSDFPIMGESTKHVKDVWVPLQIDGRREAHLHEDRIDHTELLRRMKADERRNVALIKGDPGMGKTTLAKKIAYDWATDYTSSGSPQFSLVLSVPLRSAGKSTMFDQLAIDYFCTIGGGQLVKGISKDKLKEEIVKLESQLLVILDGLDEYGNYSDSPFKVMFASPFSHSTVYSKEPTPMITFKLIITSRPYACERVHMGFPLLRFVLLPLYANHLDNFIQLYCETSQGAARVTEYLRNNAQLVINVPLILTFICYLADSVEEIPTNMTSLYDNLIRQMLSRENRQRKLAKSIDMQKWKDSNVVKTTGELAFSEIKKENFEFTKDSFDNSGVTDDSFICGFLLHKFDFAKDLLMAEFPHRSIQEFFAALHCYQLMLAGCKDELGDIRKLILSRDSQFGRFLFGICSQERQFDQMTNWLSPSLGDSENILSLANEINQFGTSLIDCSSLDNKRMGKRLLESIGHLEERITSHMRMYMYTLGNTLRLRNLSAEFKDSLRLVDLTRDPSGDSHDWFMADNRQLARLAVVFSSLPKLLEEKFDRIDIFIWYIPIDLDTSVMEWKTLFSQIRSLPPVRTIIMSPEKSYPSAFTSVFVRIGYGRTIGSELTNFQFRYEREERKELLKAVPDEKLVKLTETKREKKIHSDGDQTIDINVTVDRCESQSALIYSLIRLSLLLSV